ncbi:MAG: hypothetical protein Q8O34_05015 [Rhodocyclaceae bacterium]|nr:hypothetical protein [Rhodocyclaceae bacterium]
MGASEPASVAAYLLGALVLLAGTVLVVVAGWLGASSMLRQSAQ